VSPTGDTPFEEWPFYRKQYSLSRISCAPVIAI